MQAQDPPGWCPVLVGQLCRGDPRPQRVSCHELAVPGDAGRQRGPERSAEVAIRPSEIIFANTPVSRRRTLIKYSHPAGPAELGEGGVPAAPPECRRLIRKINFRVISANAITIKGQKPCAAPAPCGAASETRGALSFPGGRSRPRPDPHPARPSGAAPGAPPAAWLAGKGLASPGHLGGRAAVLPTAPRRSPWGSHRPHAPHPSTSPPGLGKAAGHWGCWGCGSGGGCRSCLKDH